MKPEHIWEQKHTPEPWKIGAPPPNGEQTIGTEQGLMVAVATTGAGVSSEANARRIVACVNACAGIPLHELEQANYVHAYRKVLKDALTQRDELLAALEQFVTWGRMQHKAQSKGCHATFDMMSLKDEIDLAEAAIASVKDGAA